MLEGLSSERVLTMEYMTGVGVTDIDALKREGLNPAEVCAACQLEMCLPLWTSVFCSWKDSKSVPAADMLRTPAQLPLQHQRPDAIRVLARS